ncbi:MAG: DUF4345 domain-containing protein [bacterium]|nr:DUF4345 domain-containing protein [bacterium]
MTTPLKVLVGIIAVLLALLGLRWMFDPNAAAESVGMVLNSPDALNTARGDLGGMFLACVALCIQGIRSGEGRWLLAVATLVGFVAAGRVIGLAMDGSSSAALTSIPIELGMVAVLVIAARQTR